MRDECRGCILQGKAVICASNALRWAVYDMMCRYPLLFGRDFKEPEPCYMREVEEENDRIS